MADELVQVGIKVNSDTRRRIEGHRVRLQRRAGTVEVTTSDAVRDALLIGLHEAENGKDGDER